MTFKELGLQEELLSAITKLGFHQPTDIQEEAIPFLLRKQQDLVGLAQTGTGKTAAFGLPVLQQVQLDDKSVQVLILCPTRELCLQIARDLESYAKDLRKLKILAVYGGTSIGKQRKQLKKGVHVVVGTPGRTLDLIRRNSLDVTSIQNLILDEADEMLNMGFQEDLKAILKDTPSQKRTLLFSATMPREMEGIVQKFMNRPHTIKAARQNIGATNVEHHFYVAKAKDRFASLQRLVDAHPEIYGIIFCRTRRETQQIADKLMSAGYNADTIHGDLSQNQRDSVMNNFKNKNIQLLVATDVAARGIDVDELTHVINYQLPDDPEVYIHRSGRTGRAGNEGISICIINTREGKRLSQIEKMLGKEFVRREIPTGEEICGQQIRHFIQQIKNTNSDQNIIAQYWPLMEKEIGHLSSDEIINRLFSMEISRFLETYQNSTDLNASLSKKDSGKDSRGRKRPSNWAAFTLQAGSKQRMNPKRLIALVNEQTDSNDISIGEIIVKNKTTYFEVDADKADRVESAFSGLIYGDKVALKHAHRKPEPTQRSKRRNNRTSHQKSSSKKRKNRNKRRR